MGKSKEFVKKIKRFNQDLAKLLEQHNLEMTISIDFPMYKELPAEVQLALQILQNHKGQFIMQFQETKPLENGKQENK